MGVVPWTLLVLLAASSVLSQDGVGLFRRMQDALGGADRIAAVHDYEEHVRAESWDGNTGRSLGEVRKRTRWIRPNHLRVDQIGPGSTYVLYFDGTSGWEILPGTEKAVEIAGGELAFARAYVRNFALNAWLADRDPSIRITSPSPTVIRVSDGDISHQYDLTLDPATWLPLKKSSISLSDPAHPTPSDDVTKEWEMVQGIRFPRHWVVFRGGMRVAEALDARHAVNTGLRLADLAAKPADFKPVLSSR
ncbi:MAG TPA: hypothetical protein VKE51_39545 [Vicinamibacterales bacterium]|nr:hypothetical protein [Vicinamibacterales bacterium]